MAGFDLGEGIRRLLLAGVGAVATGAEKSQQLIEELVKKGELTVEQGKALNEELSRKAEKAANETQDALLRARMAAMSAEEREAYTKKVADIANEINANVTNVEVEVEEAPEEASEETAEKPADEATEE